MSAPSTPRSCVVLGCGRSGTSLLSGLLAGSGYHLGRTLLRADPSNPKGYFESGRINRLNEQLLAPYTTDVLRAADGRPLAARPLREGERWLAALPAAVPVARPEALADDLRLPPTDGPTARKDPRFSWTLQAWDPALADSVRVCVFRDPSATARSILTMTDQGDLGLGLEGALAVWASNYRRCLHLADSERGEGRRWVFVHYAAILDGTGFGELEDALETELDRSFIDPELQRSPVGAPPEGEIAEVYAELRTRAGLAAAG
ncbi:sulfotransferase [Motilibacter aurantiacus]|uniref:sulfotransferase n=1 Tax=Motilibacter aurantiacus TaxID=2714955 RepID=UPI001409AD87|nr:sulfotransferase [Motilibacter aurantiacus]NHC47608.1 hypothetical protein [Motilibacter aurantiacus]